LQLVCIEQNLNISESSEIQESENLQVSREDGYNALLDRPGRCPCRERGFEDPVPEDCDRGRLDFICWPLGAGRAAASPEAFLASSL
jgi:hypothetical protein